MTNHFDNVAQNWDKNEIHVKRTKAIETEFRKMIVYKENQTAMEFGAGTGLLSIALKDMFSEITLMDSSIEMVNVTKNKLISENINNLQACFFDLEKDDFTLKTFDVIFTQMALHHVGDVKNILFKFYNLLNIGGFLIIADLYIEDGTFHDKDFNGHLGFNPELLSNDIQDIGFNEIKFKQCFEIIKLDNQFNEKAYPVFILKCKKVKK